HNLDTVVGLYAIHEGTLIAPLNGGRGNDGGILLGVDQQPRIHELIVPQSTILIVEDGLQAKGAGGLIDLVVYGEQGARGDFRSIVAAQGQYLQGRAGSHAVVYGSQVIFRKREDSRDGLHLSDHQKAVLV